MSVGPLVMDLGPTWAKPDRRTSAVATTTSAESGPSRQSSDGGMFGLGTLLVLGMFLAGGVVIEELVRRLHPARIARHAR